MMNFLEIPPELLFINMEPRLVRQYGKKNLLDLENEVNYDLFDTENIEIPYISRQLAVKTNSFSKSIFDIPAVKKICSENNYSLTENSIPIIKKFNTF